MKIEINQNQISIQFLDLVVDSIRVLGQMAETIIFWLTSVDGLRSKGFSDFSSSLLIEFINNLGVGNYAAKNRCTMLTRPQF